MSLQYSKNKLVFLITLLCISFTFISCDEKLNDSDSNKIDFTLSTTFSNPYDSVGIKHNEILEEYHNSKLPHDSTHLQHFNHSGTFFVARTVLDTMMTDMSIEINTLYGTPLSEINNDITDFNEFLEDSGMFSVVNGTEVMNGFISNIDNIIDESFARGAIDSLNYLVLKPYLDYMKDYNFSSAESYMDNYPWDTLNTTDYEVALTALSVFNHSREYWSDFLGTKNISKPISITTVTQDEALDAANASIAVLGADVLGTLAGGLLGMAAS